MRQLRHKLEADLANALSLSMRERMIEDSPGGECTRLSADRRRCSFPHDPVHIAFLLNVKQLNTAHASRLDKETGGQP
jgi:hypothetical protein